MRLGPATGPLIATTWSIPYLLFSWLFATFGAFSALTFAERVAIERIEAMTSAKDARAATRRLPAPRAFGVGAASFSKWLALCVRRVRLLCALPLTLTATNFLAAHGLPTTA